MQSNKILKFKTCNPTSWRTPRPPLLHEDFINWNSLEEDGCQSWRILFSPALHTCCVTHHKLFGSRTAVIHIAVIDNSMWKDCNLHRCSYIYACSGIWIKCCVYLCWIKSNWDLRQSLIACTSCQDNTNWIALYVHCRCRLQQNQSVHRMLFFSSLLFFWVAWTTCCYID